MDYKDKVGEESISKVLKNTKRSFNLRIVKVVIVIAFFAWVAWMIPAALWGVQSLHQVKASRALMDAIQFSQPDKVNSWGNSAVDRLSMSVPLRITSIPVTGRKYGEQREFAGGMSVITGKVTVPVIIGVEFLHPDLFRGINPGRERNPETQASVLEKNAAATVSTVDYSLNRLMNLSEAAGLLEKYDVDICWLAVEAGIEGKVPKNMSFEGQQVLQWGIPGKLSKPGEFDYAVLKKDNAGTYEKAVLEEMKWLDENKGILTPDRDLLQNNGISSSVEGKAAYVVKNGIKIYGLRLTGPSSELLKLKNELNPRMMTVVNMDFWNW